MSVVEAQIPLPAPPTGMDLVNAEHGYNPHSGFYEPPLKNVPLTASLAVTAAVQNLVVGVTVANPIWVYSIVYANNTAAGRFINITEPGGQFIIVAAPANTTVALISTPDAPLFRNTAAGNITVQGDAPLSGAVTITYTTK